MRYLIADDEISEKVISQRQKLPDKLIEGLEPVEDIFDRRILYEMSGRKIEDDDYPDETSEEEDVVLT